MSQIKIVTLEKNNLYASINKVKKQIMKVREKLSKEQSFKKQNKIDNIKRNAEKTKGERLRKYAGRNRIINWLLGIQWAVLAYKKINRFY